MYIGQFAGLGQGEDLFLEDEGYYDDYYYNPESIYDAAVSPSVSGPTQSTDWTGMFKTALTTWGTLETIKSQQEIEQARIVAASQPRTPYTTSPLPSTYYPQRLTPFPSGGSGGTLLGMSMTTLLLLAAAGVGGYFLLKD